MLIEIVRRRYGLCMNQLDRRTPSGGVLFCRLRPPLQTVESLFETRPLPFDLNVSREFHQTRLANLHPRRMSNIGLREWCSSHNFRFVQRDTADRSKTLKLSSWAVDPMADWQKTARLELQFHRRKSSNNMLVSPFDRDL